jgi:hypothetical protein
MHHIHKFKLRLYKILNMILVFDDTMHCGCSIINYYHILPSFGNIRCFRFVNECIFSV